MSTELAEFSDEAFDAIAFINASCRDRQSEEPLDKYLAELEMRLQLTAEEIESVLQVGGLITYLDHLFTVPHNHTCLHHPPPSQHYVDLIQSSAKSPFSEALM